MLLLSLACLTERVLTHLQAEVVARNHEILSIIHNLKHPLGLRASSLAVRFAETRGEKSEVLGPPSWQQKRQVEDHPLQEPERDLKVRVMFTSFFVVNIND